MIAGGTTSGFWLGLRFFRSQGQQKALDYSSSEKVGSIGASEREIDRLENDPSSALDLDSAKDDFSS